MKSCSLAKISKFEEIGAALLRPCQGTIAKVDFSAQSTAGKFGPSVLRSLFHATKNHGIRSQTFEAAERVHCAG